MRSIVTVSYQYDANNRITRVTLPEGNRADFMYDSRGNVITLTETPKSGSGLSPIEVGADFPDDCANPVTCNLPTSASDALDNVTEFEYDPVHGGVTVVTEPDPDGAGGQPRPQTRFTYDDLSAYYKNSAGAIVAAPTPVWLPTEISACATLAVCTGANAYDETRAIVAYGAAGVANNLLPTSLTVRAGDNSVSSTSSTAYDGVGNVLTTDGPLAGAGDTTRLLYDANRRVTGVIGPDPDGATTTLKHRAVSIEYNDDGQATSETFGVVDSQADAAWSTFAGLQRQTTVYDFAGRPIRSLAEGRMLPSGPWGNARRRAGQL